MNKKTDLLRITLILLFGILFIIAVIVSLSRPKLNQDCLKNIAIRQCENRNLSFDNMIINQLSLDNHGSVFYCKSDLREISNEKSYKFLDIEVDGCKD